MENNKQISTKDVLKICNGTLICGDMETTFDSFCTDTRKLKTDDIYVGIKGENHDGNIFFIQALEKGAKACLLQNIDISNDIIQKYKDRTIIMVSDTILALQQLATFKRQLYDIPVVAITGSVGKTSTKDIIASVLSQKFNVLKTEGNYNNHIGVPLTILRLKNHTAMVIEMGMNHLGEISLLTKIANPTVAVITNVGTAHIGNLGSRENILKAKLEILEGLKESGKIVINNDNDLLHKWNLEQNQNFDIITFGMDNKSEIMPNQIELLEDKSIYSINIDNNKYTVNIPTPGSHFVSNSLCAIAVGQIFNIDITKIIKGIENYQLTKKRMEIVKLPNNVTIINDCYNANYDSMKASLEFLSSIQNTKKIAVLGDMLELGDFSEKLHRDVGRLVAKNKINELFTIGKDAKFIAKQAEISGLDNNHIHILNNNIDAINILQKLIPLGNISILIKASNGMNFEEIFNKILIFRSN